MSSKEKDDNWFKRHKILTGILVLVVIGIAMSATKSSDTTKQSPQQTATAESSKVTEDKPAAAKKDEPKKEEKKERLTVDEGWSLDKSNPYMAQVVGTVSNNSDKPVNGYIQVTFSALDASGANVGDCLANANTVDANGKWKFKAICSGDDIETVRFKDITGF